MSSGDVKLFAFGDEETGLGEGGLRELGELHASPFPRLFLERRNELTRELREALGDLQVHRAFFMDSEVIVRRGPCMPASCLLIRGMVLRRHYDMPGDGVVSALGVPGDFIDLHSFLLDRLDHDVVSVGRTVVEFVDHDILSKLVIEHPHLMRALWRETLVDAKTHRAWIVARAALRAAPRVAHLLCEIEVRLRRVGLADSGNFTMPLDQKRVADVLGFSAVHVNRAIQDLRADALVSWEGRSVHFLDHDALRRFAAFDEAYLMP